MCVLATCLALLMTAQAALASAEVDRLVDALGVPALIEAFTIEGVQSGQFTGDGVLGGRGGDIWAGTVGRLYDSARMESEVHTVMSDTMDADVVAQALLFFDSELERLGLGRACGGPGRACGVTT